MKYNQIYKNKNVWGDKPNNLLQKIFNQIESCSNFLDLGCGQGRDSLFMLQNGFRVTAVDISQEGLQKIKDFIKANYLFSSKIDLVHENIETFNIKKDKYTVINIFNSLQFILKQEALELINRSQMMLKKKGYIIISGFTTRDSFYAKEVNQNRCFFEMLELKKIFSNFNIVFYEENEILDNGHPGSPHPHTHSVVKLIAQKL